MSTTVTIVAPSAILEMLRAYYATMTDHATEEAGDVVRAMNFMASFQAKNLDRLAGFVNGADDFGLALPAFVNTVKTRVDTAYAVAPVHSAARLADLETMLSEMVAYDAVLDAAEKSPDGDDYNELWNIFHARLKEV